MALGEAEAVQVDGIKPTMIAPGTRRSELKYDRIISNFAFNFGLWRYTWTLPTIDFPEPADAMDAWVAATAGQEPRRVRLTGLVGAAHLNGRSGTVGRTNAGQPYRISYPR
jgi:hypothetical protein